MSILLDLVPPTPPAPGAANWRSMTGVGLSWIVLALMLSTCGGTP